MQNLTELIRAIPQSTEESPEDIFASAPGLIFPDDLRVQHGEAGTLLIYDSLKFGEIKLQTADPLAEDDRRLFGHYLWNAGILMAERLSGNRMHDDDERELWDVAGQTVIELGAGVGLTGMVAHLYGASEVLISDYPAPTILDNIRSNLKRNADLFRGTPPVVQGHEWGVFDNDFAMANKHHFTRILAADCFWMPNFHEALVESMLYFLATDPSARVLIMAGFHTGRAKLAAFFDTAERLGLVPCSLYEENAVGDRRDWAKMRDGGREDHTERKKWLTVAVMQRKDG